MKEDITYRIVHRNEIEQYHKLRLCCLKDFPQNFGTLYEDQLESSNFKFDKVILQNNNTDFLMGAFKKEKLIGICGFIHEKRTKNSHLGEVSSMYVSPRYSGMKIGQTLLLNTIKLAFDNIEILEQIKIAVVERNKAALYMYTKIGFVEYGRFQDYFKYGENYETLIYMKFKKYQSEIFPSFPTGT
ncbi:GNAT family N-acetyltransferase [Sphingobacterium faecale]|uniref:GNAT family N-acetyltransferase n=1 Tax=Sphingobacterium faecale TaxID=2803775 RepID=A0ABS1R5D7_9SPHI|nr:GNAT family protein [Sphingobacterium faecale]MBL1409918.1 GNAT family N-acetyltransferase [Sphingobacterium faecale]